MNVDDTWKPFRARASSAAKLPGAGMESNDFWFMPMLGQLHLVQTWMRTCLTTRESPADARVHATRENSLIDSVSREAVLAHTTNRHIQPYTAVMP